MVDSEKQRVNEYRCAGPQKHQKAEKEACEEDLRPCLRPNEKHSGQRYWLPLVKRAALFVQSDCEKRRDDHVPSDGWNRM